MGTGETAELHGKRPQGIALAEPEGIENDLCLALLAEPLLGETVAFWDTPADRRPQD